MIRQLNRPFDSRLNSQGSWQHISGCRGCHQQCQETRTVDLPAEFTSGVDLSGDSAVITLSIANSQLACGVAMSLGIPLLALVTGAVVGEIMGVGDLGQGGLASAGLLAGIAIAAAANRYHQMSVTVTSHHQRI